MNTAAQTTHSECSWLHRLSIVAEVESSAYQFGLLGSPMTIHDQLAGQCAPNATTLRNELSASPIN